MSDPSALRMWFRTQKPHGLKPGDEIVIYHRKVGWWLRLVWHFTGYKPTFLVVEVVDPTSCYLTYSKPGFDVSAS